MLVTHKWPPHETLAFFAEMLVQGYRIQQDKQVHNYAISENESDVVVGTALVDMFSKCGNIDVPHTLVDMFSKCGNIDVPHTLFERMLGQHGVSWKATISACS